MESGEDRILKFWKDFNKNSKINEFESEELEIVKRKEQSLENRKNLSKHTKSFKNLSKEEKQKGFGKLVKKYQKEINNLTQRAIKVEEKYMMIVHEVISKVKENNPSEIVDQEKLTELKGYENTKEQNKRLKNELKEYKKEFENIQNQEVTIRQLQEALAQEKEKNQNIQKSSVEVKNLQALSDKEKIKSHSLQTKLNEVEEEKEKISIMQNSTIELLQNEIKHMTLENNQLKNENSLVKKKLDELEKLRSTEELTDKQPEICLKCQQIQKKINKMNQEMNQNNNQLSEYIQKWKKGKEENLELKSQIENLPTLKEFQETKKRLQTLEKLEFSGTQNEEDNENLSIEQLLNNKIKTHESSLIKLKNENIQITINLEESKKESIENQKTIAKQKELIDSLESDLLALSSEKKDNDVSTNVSEENGREDEKESMFDVIVQQRKRLKNELLEVQSQLEIEKKKNLKIEAKLKQRKNENISLIKKIRYIENYNSTMKEKEIPRKRGEVIVEINDPTLEKYRSLYEKKVSKKNIDPFSNFSKVEKKEFFDNMNPFERLAVTINSRIFSSKTGRTFFFFYILFLHLILLLIVLVYSY